MGNSTFLRNPQVRDEASKDLKLILLSKTEKELYTVTKWSLLEGYRMIHHDKIKHYNQ